MTPRTRRRVLVSLVVLALTLPAESILLKAVTVPSVKDAAKQYVSSLSASQLQAAASSIESFPYVYRRQIMAALTPSLRAAVWQNHIALYVASHPGLDPSTVSLLTSLSGLITPEYVSISTSVDRAHVEAIIAEIQQSIGVADTLYLFKQLGPADNAATVAEPTSERLANYVRNAFEVLADADECNCIDSTDCGGETICGDSNGCQPGGWPQCSWFWLEPCTNECKILMIG